jgi:glycogen synthase
VFTLHNIHTDRDTLRRIETFGIDVTRFWHDLYLEKHPEAVPNPWETIGVDFLLSGVKAASYTNTVSPTFLIEIINGFFPELFPTPLREELRAKHSLGCASGILNAPMNSVDPRLAPLRRNYDETTVIEGKRANKIAFQEELGLQANPDAPLFFWPHRLYPQKGPHLLAEIAMPLVQHYWNEGLQIAVVGSGDPKWEQAFGALSYASHGRIAFRSFDPLLSEVGKAAADYVLMPSLYEPCGLPQMEGPRYGALPIVRSTGGLRDTIEHLAPSGETGNGFVFNDFVPDALWWACTEAMRFQAQPLEWRAAVIRRVMSEARAKFNLEVTTLKYVRIYERLLGEKLL